MWSNVQGFAHGLLVLALAQSSLQAATTELHVEYFASADLHCQFPNEGVFRNVTAVYFWILPSGEIKYPQDAAVPSQHVSVDDDSFKLTIDRVDDEDFGIYYCIVRANDSDVSVVQIGLNTDGPYYGDKIKITLRNNAIVGAISAGSALGAMVVLWIVCAKCLPKSKPVPATKGADNKAFDHRKEDDKEVQINATNNEVMTKLDGNIYYMADGSEVNVRQESEGEVKQVNEEIDVTADRLSLTDSGHYQSIGSLGRDCSLPNEDEIDKLDGGHKETNRATISATVEAARDSLENQRKSTQEYNEQTFTNQNQEIIQDNKNLDAEDDNKISTIVSDLQNAVDVNDLYSKPVKPKRAKDRIINDYETVVLTTVEDSRKITIEPNLNENAADTETNETQVIEKDSLQKNNVFRPFDKTGSRADSSTSSEIDEETLMNYNNVLSSLVKTRLSKNVQSTDEGNEDESENISSDESSKSVVDIRL